MKHAGPRFAIRVDQALHHAMLLISALLAVAVR